MERLQRGGGCLLGSSRACGMGVSMAGEIPPLEYQSAEYEGPKMIAWLSLASRFGQVALRAMVVQ